MPRCLLIANGCGCQPWTEPFQHFGHTFTRNANDPAVGGGLRGVGQGTLNTPKAYQQSGEPGAMPEGDLPRGRRLKNGNGIVACVSVRRRRIGLVGLVILGVHALLIICPGTAYAGPTPAATGDVNSRASLASRRPGSARKLLAWYRPHRTSATTKFFTSGGTSSNTRSPIRRGPSSRPTSSTLSSTAIPSRAHIGRVIRR